MPHDLYVPLRILAALMLFVCVPSIGCAQKMSVETEYVKAIDFSKYQTYRWMTDDLVLIQLGTGDAKIRTVENEKRIRAAVERELEAKGLEQATAQQEADLVIAFTVGTKVRYQIQGGVTGLDLVAAPNATITRGVLTLYVVDAATDTQIWSAWTKKDLEPGTDPDTVINAAVSALMNKFPR